MRNSVTYSSIKGNSYLYAIGHMSSFLIHPDLKRIFNGEKNVDPYYWNKYQYLEKHNIFKGSDYIDLETNFDKSSLEENIRNIKQLVFETTDYCNLNCKYCSLGSVYNFGKSELKNLDLNHAITTLKYIVEKKMPKSKLSISFFGGEPLINIKLIKEVVKVSKEICKRKEIELSFNMTSNVTLIDKYIDFLVENNFHILISLDGDENSHSYRVFRNSGENSFDCVIKNIDLIKEKYPDYFNEYISFNSVLNNRGSIGKIYEFIYNRYHKIPRITELNTDHVRDNLAIKSMFKNRVESEEEFLNSKTEFSEQFRNRFALYKEAEKFLKNMTINFYISNLAYLIYEQVKPLPTGTCSPFQRKIYLNTNNDLLPCEKVSYKYVLGKVVGGNVIIDMDEVSERFSKYYKSFKRICQDCYAGKMCPICFLTLENLDDIDKEDFYCPGFQDYDQYEKTLSRIFSFLEKYPRDFFRIMNESMLN